MAIYTPGKRDRHGRIGGSKRSVVAVLSLTAMVDLFTVLVVFLLQNYATTGEVINIPEGVKLPNAQEVKELKPANVIVVSEKEISVNNNKVADYQQVKNQQDWLVPAVSDKIREIVEKGEREKATLGNKIKSAVSSAKEGAEEDTIDQFRKVTIQADKEVDFLTVKKVMYSVTDGGIYEINFAVMKNSESKVK